MTPIKFKGYNVIYAENQSDDYLPLPACRFKEGEVITCWKLSFVERLNILFKGKLWLSVLTFNRRLQPLLLTIKKPFKQEEKQ